MMKIINCARKKSYVIKLPSPYSRKLGKLKNEGEILCFFLVFCVANVYLSVYILHSCHYILFKFDPIFYILYNKVNINVIVNV